MDENPYPSPPLMMAATSVPVFAPRTFADLFRFLAQEIAERGYHFQDTADSVTARLGEARRSLARTLTIAGQRGIDVERELRR